MLKGLFTIIWSINWLIYLQYILNKIFEYLNSKYFCTIYECHKRVNSLNILQLLCSHFPSIYLQI